MKPVNHNDQFRRRWEVNIKMEVGEIGCELDSTDSRQGPVADCCEHNSESHWHRIVIFHFQQGF